MLAASKLSERSSALSHDQTGLVGLVYEGITVAA